MSFVTRRKVLAMGAAGTLTAACSSGKERDRNRIAVVGGGIIGASIAYHLAKMSAQVTVLERHEIATRSSRGTFAWLNATWAKQPQHYHNLNQLGLAGWKELERELDIPIKWGGSIEWFGDAERQALLEKQIAEQVNWGEPARMINGDELKSLEPAVNFSSTRSAAFSPNDGALDPVLATRLLLEKAESLGAVVKTNSAVTRVRDGDGLATSILQTVQGDLEVDAFVLATGADTDATKLLANIEIPQRSTPGVIVVTKPMKAMLNRILVAPGVHIHQRRDGRIVLGEQDGAPKTDAHASRLADRPNQFPNRELAEQHAGRILTIAEQYLAGITGAEVEDVYIGWRPLPLDGHPVVGFSPAQKNAYLAISHSGVSLAPIIGRLASQEIIEGLQVERLAPYRPNRPFEDGNRY